MNRQEFILALRRELKKLPPEEIVAATEFFEEFIDEMLAGGEKTEEEIIRELGSPKRAAAEIKADYAARILDGEEIAEGSKMEGSKSKISAVWWVVLGICSAPVSIPLAICIAAVAFCVVISLVGVIIAVYSTIIGCGVAALAAIVFGCVAFGGSFATGILFLGGGLALAALTAAAGVGAFVGTRELIKLVVRLIRDAHSRKRKKKIEEMSGTMGEGWSFRETPEDPRDGFINGGMITGGEKHE
ncbi:MAG: DUF1700 domain-containing protein [Lentihominibacter sp.]